MDKSKVIRYLVDRRDYTKEQRDIIEYIEDARVQLRSAMAYFNMVNDSKLIDYAIYMENAARARYTYLLAEARRLEVKVDCSYMIEEGSVG